MGTKKGIPVTVRAVRVYKKLNTETRFRIFSIGDDGHFNIVKNNDGKELSFNSRRAAENFCAKNDTGYIECKYIFYV